MMVAGEVEEVAHEEMCLLEVDIEGQEDDYQEEVIEMVLVVEEKDMENRLEQKSPVEAMEQRKTHLH